MIQEPCACPGCRLPRVAISRFRPSQASADRTKARNHTPIASRVPPPVAWGVARRSAGCGPACDEIAKRWSLRFHEPMYDLAPARALPRCPPCHTVCELYAQGDELIMRMRRPSRLLAASRLWFNIRLLLLPRPPPPSLPLLLGLSVSPGHTRCVGE